MNYNSYSYSTNKPLHHQICLKHAWFCYPKYLFITSIFKFSVLTFFQVRKIHWALGLNSVYPETLIRHIPTKGDCPTQTVPPTNMRRDIAKANHIGCNNAMKSDRIPFLYSSHHICWAWARLSKEMIWQFSHAYDENIAQVWKNNTCSQKHMTALTNALPATYS